MFRSQRCVKGCVTWATRAPIRLQSSPAPSYKANRIDLQSMLQEERTLARELRAQLRAKDSLLQKKDEDLHSLLEKKDSLLEKKDKDLHSLLEKKDSLLEKKDEDLRTKDALLAAKAKELSEMHPLAAQLKLQQFELVRYKSIVNCRGALEFVASQIGLEHPGDEM